MALKLLPAGRSATLAPGRAFVGCVGCAMSKQYAAFHVSWRDSRKRPILFEGDEALGRAAADALEAKLNALAEDGWIIDKVIPASGLTTRQSAAFTIIAFK